MSESVGIIYPPPELRGIVDSTAKYVAKNGGAFEERIKREHRDKPKFSFLFADDPFNAYYQYKVGEIRNAIAQEAAAILNNEPQSQVDQNSDISQQEAASSPVAKVAGRDDQYNDQSEPHLHTQQNQHHQSSQEEPQQVKESDDAINQFTPDGGPRVRLKLDEYIQEMTIKLEEPPELNYLATPAPSLTQREGDIIKLTAQFIATYGRSFLLELVSREQNNSEFDFLKPQHGQFSYMTNLIMQYALIQNQPLDILEVLEKDASSQRHLIDKVKMRAEWNRMLELEQKKREEAEEKEKLLYSQIDWHDFVIVETIDYQHDEKGEYPPTTADQVGTRLLLQQRYEEQNVPEEMEIDMDMDSDEEGSDSGAGAEQEAEDSNGGFAVPDLMLPRPDKVIIRRDYDPKMPPVRAHHQDNYFVSPITNERIPVDKIHEHVRYNLSDPRYLEKKDQQLQERMSEETVFASGSQIQDSLKNLAERRTDIFGRNDKETAIGRRIQDDQ